MRLPLFLLIGLLSQARFCPAALDCLSFDLPHVAAGETVTRSIQHGLVFHLNAETAREYHVGSVDQRIWHISVGPSASTDRIDYLWPVSLPISSTRQLFIGPALDWTAEQSLTMPTRRLNFVIDGADYERARAVRAAAERQVVATGSFDSSTLRALGKGQLSLAVTGYSLDGDAIRSLSLDVSSCVPR